MDTPLVTVQNGRIIESWAVSKKPDTHLLDLFQRDPLAIDAPLAALIAYPLRKGTTRILSAEGRFVEVEYTPARMFDPVIVFSPETKMYQELRRLNQYLCAFFTKIPHISIDQRNTRGKVLALPVCSEVEQLHKHGKLSRMEEHFIIRAVLRGITYA